MNSLNKVQIIGRLGADPDVRYTQNNTAVANMSVATSSRYKDNNNEIVENTEWHKVVAWGKLAEICQQYLTKGGQVYFEGSLQTRSWEDKKDGIKRYSTEIKASDMIMLDSKGSGGSSDNQNQGQANEPRSGGAAKSSAPSTAGFEVDTNMDDDDLPF